VKRRVDKCKLFNYNNIGEGKAMTKLQSEIIADLKRRALFGTAQVVRESWENGAPFFCRHYCPFELRVKFAEGNRDIMLPPQNGALRKQTLL